MNWREAANNIRWQIQPLIDGRYRPSTASEFFDNVTPATETTLCRIAKGSAEDIEIAVRAARRRFDDGCWSQMGPSARGAILMRLADLIVEHRMELALLDCVEMGKPIQSALHDTEHLAPFLLRSWAGCADQLLGESVALTPGTMAFNTYEPRGVVGAITPWNFPTVNAVIKFAPALAAGNTVVLKPSELASSSALRLAELALEAGIPEGVLNVVPGLGATVGTALAVHRGVDLLSFTGSTATGRKLLEFSGKSNGKPLLLECGGKSPQVVFDDVDNLDRVAEATVRSAFSNQGQVCSAHTRLLVHHGIKDLLLEKVVRLTRELQPRDPLEDTTTFGPLASPLQRDRVKSCIEEALDAGANAVLHGSIQLTGGCFVAPTIFDRVDARMSVVQEEVFGPVLCVQPFGTEEEAIALANDTQYGLAATVWTRDMGRGKRLARAIKAGGVVIRTSGGEEPPGHMLSHEPQKASGFGVEIGLRGLASYSTLKSVSWIGA